MMSNRTINESHIKTNNITSRRNKDRKKERGKDRDGDKEIQYRKTINMNQNTQYEEFEFSPISNNYNTHFNAENIERKIDQNADKSGSKLSKGTLSKMNSNKVHGIWPFHSNKDINSYYINTTEPKYYLGI